MPMIPTKCSCGKVGGCIKKNVDGRLLLLLIIASYPHEVTF
jgi:hypothetical protein